MITCDKKVRLSFETKLRNMRVDLHVAVIDAEQRLASLAREFINLRRILLAEGGLPTHEVVKERCTVAREKGKKGKESVLKCRKRIEESQSLTRGPVVVWYAR